MGRQSDGQACRCCTRSAGLAYPALEQGWWLKAGLLTHQGWLRVRREDPQFPAGKARLETISVLGCAAIMTFGALQVISDSAQQLYDGFVKGERARTE